MLGTTASALINILPLLCIAANASEPKEALDPHGSAWGSAVNFMLANFGGILFAMVLVGIGVTMLAKLKKLYSGKGETQVFFVNLKLIWAYANIE